MCTAIFDKRNGGIVGRTLDLECSFGEELVIAPRGFEWHYLNEEGADEPLALLGIAHVFDGTPLYYDAVNEAGLFMAALNFPGCAVYHEKKADAHNVASFEVIPWVLRQCRSLDKAVELLLRTNVTSQNAAKELPSTPLHWILADATGAYAVEPLASGLSLTPNPFGVLTNAPEFSYHARRVSDFMGLSASAPENHFSVSLPLSAYSRGMGAMGMPGDLSSSSRFVRACFAKANVEEGSNRTEAVSRMFHVMDTVCQPRGFARTEEGQPIESVYTACAVLGEPSYYLSTYACRRIHAVCLQTHENGNALSRFPLSQSEDVLWLDDVPDQKRGGGVF